MADWLEIDHIQKAKEMVKDGFLFLFFPDQQAQTQSYPLNKEKGKSSRFFFSESGSRQCLTVFQGLNFLWLINWFPPLLIWATKTSTQLSGNKNGSCRGPPIMQNLIHPPLPSLYLCCLPFKSKACFQTTSDVLLSLTNSILACLAYIQFTHLISQLQTPMEKVTEGVW